MRSLVLVALVCGPGLLGSQTVRGTIVEQTSQQPIVGAVVFLMDTGNRVAARDLTDERGAYQLSAARAGTYRVRTMRIGFRPVVSEPIELAPDREATLPLAVATIPVSLTAVRVERRATCPAREDATPAYNAWSEVATALNAALLSSRLRGTTATIVSYDRWTEPGSEVVLRQGANVRTGLPGQPWRSVGADSLHRAGFVVKEADGWHTFHAPDLDVLLSEMFLEDHCLQLRAVDKGEIAVEFTPSRDRGRVAEIRGFVWLDARSLELKRLQFRYVNVQREYEQADAGGDLEFLKLRNGNWVISRWQIRMPVAFRTDRSDTYGGLSGNPEIRATEVKTTGGDLLRVMHRGDTLWALPARSIEGRVLDSATGRPMARARLALSGTSYAATTDESGRFRIDDVLPGAYSVRVRTPELDSLAAFYEATVPFVPDIQRTEVRVPNRDQMVARWCPALHRSDRVASGRVGLLYGVIVASDSTPVADAAVAVEWTDVARGGAGLVRRDNEVKASSDRHGVYRLCSVPVDHPLLLSTEFDDAALPTPIRIESASRMRRYDIALDANRRRITVGRTPR